MEVYQLESCIILRILWMHEKQNLKNKKCLMKLKLRWDSRWNGNSIDSVKEREVIENLQPPKNIKKLSIFSYGGKQFPNWFMENSLWNMVSLVLDECESCQHLPPLGVFPFLRVLKIIKLDGIVSIGAVFHGNNSCSFKSLEKLIFSNMTQWEKWECHAVTGAFPRLQSLSIKNCLNLKGKLPNQLVALKTLQITDCEQLVASAPRSLHFELQGCGKVLFDWATMKRFTLGGHNMEASLLEMVRHIIPENSIEHLEIHSYNLSDFPMNDDSVSLWTFPLHFFPTLRMVVLRGFGNLQMISQDHTNNNLQDLTIKECSKFESLPGNMHMLLPSLTRLCIYDCPRLESFPDGGLPSKLNFMKLKNCSRLIGSLKGALGDNPSLKSLWIEKLDAESFPDEDLLPLSLTSLTISDCPNLEKLDHRGLYQLSSLQSPSLCYCPKLQCLPEEGLPKSISGLEIDDCPLLEQSCRKSGGKDWEKIAHIQKLYIGE